MTASNDSMQLQLTMHIDPSHPYQPGAASACHIYTLVLHVETVLCSGISISQTLIKFHLRADYRTLHTDPQPACLWSLQDAAQLIVKQIKLAFLRLNSALCVPGIPGFCRHLSGLQAHLALCSAIALASQQGRSHVPHSSKDYMSMRFRRSMT